MTQNPRCTCGHRFSEHDFDIDDTGCVPFDGECPCTRFIEDQHDLPIPPSNEPPGHDPAICHECQRRFQAWHICEDINSGQVTPEQAAARITGGGAA